MTNNTISNNTAAALLTFGNGTINLINNTISGNTGGIIAPTPPEEGDGGEGGEGEPLGPESYDNLTYNLTNNIFNNTDGNCPTSGPSNNSNGGNISSDGSCTSFMNGTNDKNDTDPLLQPLTTQFPYVMPITQDSPAFGNGVTTNAPSTDQRGEPRNQGRIDSGAYQLLSATPTPNNNGTLASTGNDARIPLALAAILVAIGAAGSVVALKRR